MQNFFDAVVSYKLVWLKVLLLIFMPAAMLFDSYTETWSQTDWAAQTTFTKTRLGIKMFLASSAAFIAFIDNSLKKAEDEYNKKKFKRAVESGGDTTFMTKPIEPEK